MSNAIHKIMGDKVQIYKRPDSSFWWCSTFMDGQKRRKSTKTDSLAIAKDVAEDWYVTLKGKQRIGELKNEKTFSFAAKQFEKEYSIITKNTRSPKWVQGHKDRLRIHLIPFFGKMGLSEITAGKVQDYRIERMGHTRNGKPPAKKTLHNEIVTLSQVLKCAVRHQFLANLPDLSQPYNLQSKVSHRPWFSEKEYKQLYQATRRRAKNPPNPRFKFEAEQLHDFVLIISNSGLRPDEVKHLQFRDVEVVKDQATDETILEIEVRGKRGVGYCKSMNGAVRPFERLATRLRKVTDEQTGEVTERLPEPHDLVFVGNNIKMFNNVLTEEKLKFDRDGQARTAYSLRHSYLCFRLLEGADVWALARNARTSVDMIEQYYGKHIKTRLDASAINVRRDQ